MLAIIDKIRLFLKFIRNVSFDMNTSPRKSLILSLSFLLPALLMALVFALCGICPFGSRSLGVMDMSHQYLSFLYSLRDILSGEASLFYLPSMCLGGNMTGVASYYLLSPLNLFTCLFPRERMLEAVSFLFFIRTGLCGLTMCIFSGRRHGYGWRCLFPALAYAFMAYMVAYSFNYLWQDCVILLPLIALGISRLVRGEGELLYILCLGGALFINFYIGYILCIFSVLFFLYEYMSCEKTGRPKWWPAVLRFSLSSLLAGALAAVALLPAFLSLAGGKAEFSLSILTLDPKFFFPDLFSKLYPGAFNYEEIMPVGMPHIYCGTATVVLAVLYFVNPRIPRRRRILTGCFLAILALSFWITALDLVWHCLNTPSWYNYRYSFLFSFLLCLAADEALSHLKEGFRPWHGALALGVAAGLWILVFAGRSYAYVTWYSALEAVILTAVLAVCLLLLARPKTGKRLGCTLMAVMLLLHTGELLANAKLSLDDLTVPSSDAAAYAEYTAAKAGAFDLVPDNGSYVRTESATMHDMNRCEPMLFGYDGISHYGSTISQKSLDFLDRLGFDRYTDLWSLYGSGVTAGADTLLGVRYLVDASTVKNYAPIAQSGNYSVWENENALPIAWTAAASFDSGIDTTVSLDSHWDPMSSFDYIQALYDAAAPEVALDIYTAPEAVEIALENYSTHDGTSFTRQTEGIASVTYTLTAGADGRLYGEFEIADFPGVMVFVNNAFAASYASAQTNGTLYLGNFAAGDTVTVKLQTASDIIIARAAFATESDEAIAAYADAIRDGGCELEKLSASHYTGTFTTGGMDSLLVFTIPYDKNWTVLLDDEPAEIMEVQNCLMALSVPEGEHTVELRYVPAGIVPGAVITGIAVLLLFGIAAFRWYRKKPVPFVRPK